MTDRLLTSNVESLWAQIDKRTPDECWRWIGVRFRGGYGRVNLPRADGRQSATTAHRALWTALYGVIHPDLEVCHTCDNRACCNPAHLFVGTVHANALDKKRKGRVARMTGDKNGSCKLTEADITAIRQSPEHYKALAIQYGVSPSNIRMIRTRRTWSHV